MAKLSELYAVPDWLSVTKGDDAYDPDFPFQYLQVKLDGNVMLCVVEYCISEGWLARYKRDEGGLFINAGTDFVTEVLDGTVEVAFKEGY